MNIVEKHIITTLDVPMRIQEYAIAIFTGITTKNALKKVIKKQRVLVNDSVATTATFVNKGDCISLLEAEKVVKKIFPLSLTVLFEDEHLAVIVKPSGFPTNGNYYKTIENALPHNLATSTVEDTLPFPKPVHRLDNPTSGILLIAKSKRAEISLYQQFERQTIHKTYQAIVIGKPKDEGEINLPIDDKVAFTSYKTSRTVASLQNTYLSLVTLFPKTGRTHQLRKHLAAIGHPIVGDAIYGKPEENYKKGLFLCAKAIQFMHPITKESCTFEIDAPGKFKSLLDREARRFEKFNL